MNRNLWLVFALLNFTVGIVSAYRRELGAGFNFAAALIAIMLYVWPQDHRRG